jgi:hypothetical protein
MSVRLSIDRLRDSPAALDGLPLQSEREGARPLPRAAPRPFFQGSARGGPHYVGLSAAYALAGIMEEAKSALAEARRLEPKLTVKSTVADGPNIPTLVDGRRKAGLSEE